MTAHHIDLHCTLCGRHNVYDVNDLASDRTVHCYKCDNDFSPNIRELMRQAFVVLKHLTEFKP